MDYLCISNQGEIDANALSLMGASVKDVDAIGMFGSGFKYALATFLREGVDFRIFSGAKEIVVTTMTEEFRGQPFDVMVVDGQRTSITTRTGPKWNARFALREVWSNALDEGGAMKSLVSAVDAPGPGRTTVFVAITPTVAEVLDDWDRLFCHNVAGKYQFAEGEFFHSTSPMLYRRGVWCCEDVEIRALFSYNFNEIDLPESRIVSARMIYMLLARSIIKHPVWAKAVIDHMDDYLLPEVEMFRSLYVHTATLDAVKREFANQFDCIAQKALRDKLAPTSLRVKWLSDAAYSMWAKHFTQLEKLQKYSDHYTIIPWPIGHQDTVRNEVAYLAQRGIRFENVTFRHATFKDDETLAMAVPSTRECLIGAAVLSAGPAAIRMALVEEWTHLTHGVDDYTAAQQHVYLKLIIDLCGQVRV